MEQMTEDRGQMTDEGRWMPMGLPWRRKGAETIEKGWDRGGGSRGTVTKGDQKPGRILRLLMPPANHPVSGFPLSANPYLKVGLTGPVSRG